MFNIQILITIWLIQDIQGADGGQLAFSKIFKGVGKSKEFKSAWSIKSSIVRKTQGFEPSKEFPKGGFDSPLKNLSLNGNNF
jgi:hypothetical protein